MVLCLQISEEKYFPIYNSIFSKTFKDVIDMQKLIPRICRIEKKSVNVSVLSDFLWLEKGDNIQWGKAKKNPLVLV